MTQLDTTYDHNKYEKKWWDFWQQGKWFHAEVDTKKTPYTILIPPPNVTAQLHLGHGLNVTLQDILIRWKRMQGFNACWLPGTDHAGIATQMMVEKSLANEGKTRQELGREAFFERCVQWKDENGSTIINQLKRMGSSCDWDREAYTMDETLSRAVRKIFVDLFKAGLIYRGERLVNWDPVLKTAISDDEVYNEEENGNLWHITYLLADDPTQSVEVATTRPETLFGDTAVAVHPDDERYKHLIGKKVIVPFVERAITIIADEHVKPEFGTGCLKITPAHDPNDFAIAQRHGLSAINVMAEDASLNEVCPAPFRGLPRYEARKEVIKQLKERNQFVKAVPTRHSLPFSDRSKVAIEPRLSLQWYVKMQELAKPAIAAAQSGELQFYPELWKKTYFHWLENIQDWCISRQLWWGHRIPIWHCQDCLAVTTGMNDPTECSSCHSKAITQDPDVLDTWFSSWLWPLSPFGWPEETKEVDYFFPSQVLITGAEIIFLWVARMVMVSYFSKGKLPFKDVYFNSIVCDKKGRKFSKTLGNGIDPIELIDKYGADAVRFTCVSLAPLGGRVKMEVADFDSGNRFINKIWNASRFLLAKIAPYGDQTRFADFKESSLDLPSKWLLSEFHTVSGRIHNLLTNYQINEAMEVLYHFIWRAFCDWSLETAKESFDSEATSHEQKQNQASVLLYVFDGLLRLAAPVIPFITEEIWQKIPHHPRWDRPQSLVIGEYPNPEKIPHFPEAHASWQKVQELITGVRSVRMQANVPVKEKIAAFVQCSQKADCELFQLASPWIKKFAGVQSLEIAQTISRPEKSLIATGKGFSVYVPASEYMDFEKEKSRMEQEFKRIQKITEGLQSKLSNKDFVSRAPEEVIQKTTEQLENMQSQLNSLQDNLKALS